MSSKIEYLTPENEHLVIQGCRSGDLTAQKALYKSMSGKMFAVCLRYASDYHNAEDILQEGFIKVFRNIDKYRGEGSFEGWIRRIFVNTSIEQYRKNVKLYAVSEIEDTNISNHDSNALDSLMTEDLLQLIQTLSPGYKTIFNLFVMEGMSHAEIAQELGISEGTSKSQLARARGILQTKIEKESSNLKISVKEK